MSVAGLFSGIGGFEVAFENAGFETNVLVEVDEGARAVLAARFPNVDVCPDVQDLSQLDSDTTIVTAGFPCQDLSMAGNKAGISGPKSGVVRKLFSLIAKCRPEMVVIENVYFMLQLDSGQAMHWLASQFEEMEYRWAYRVVDTMGFGIPQRRRRVFMIGSRDVDPRRVLFADNELAACEPTPTLERPLGFYWTEGRSGIGFTVDGIPPLKVGSAVGIASPPAVLFPDGEVLTPSLAAGEELQGFIAGWTEAADGKAGRNSRWRMIGNAVSVPVAEWVAARIKAPGTVLDFEESEIEPAGRWPSAGWNVGDGRVGAICSEKPVNREISSISKFRDVSWPRLSERAITGFIRRAESANLRMPDGFLAALRGAKRKSVEVRPRG